MGTYQLLRLYDMRIRDVKCLKNYIIRRVVIAFITLICILLILYIMMSLMPGSPFNDEKMSEEQVAALYTKYGLDKPVIYQFFQYFIHMLTGDFGVSYSIQTNMPVAQMIAARLPLSIQIGLQAAIVGSFIGLTLGIISALRKNTYVDTIATAISVIGVSLPSFVFALLLSYFFAYKFDLFPILYSTEKQFISTILPTISMSMFTLASIARYSRSEIIEVMAADYIALAESKGIKKSQLIIKHVLRNAIIAVITVFATLMVELMAGSLVVEKAFSIPGLGSLYINAIQSNDYNVVISISFVYSVMFIGMMLLVDILYGIIDPRIRLAKGA
jgi:oligopeptide transport system permease protein